MDKDLVVIVMIPEVAENGEKLKFLEESAEFEFAYYDVHVDEKKSFIHNKLVGLHGKQKRVILLLPFEPELISFSLEKKMTMENGLKISIYIVAECVKKRLSAKKAFQGKVIVCQLDGFSEAYQRFDINN